ncbi:MAG: hypothetical protein DHS20C20_05960 [Ardenticatenaceae bacterium]|nr:MAG: hypothetical protein DHS20C20_05960 [Ardenticatenaceae bacterium]
MGQVGNFVTIKNGLVKAYFDKWGALGVLYALSEGSQEMEKWLTSLELTDTLDGVFAEGGFLADYDQKNLIIFGFEYDFEDKTYAEMHAACEVGIESYLKFISRYWQGWKLTFDYNGITSFKEYLDQKQIIELKFLLSRNQMEKPPPPIVVYA